MLLYMTSYPLPIQINNNRLHFHPVGHAHIFTVNRTNILHLYHISSMSNSTSSQRLWLFNTVLCHIKTAIFFIHAFFNLCMTKIFRDGRSFATIRTTWISVHICFGPYRSYYYSKGGLLPRIHIDY